MNSGMMSKGLQCRVLWRFSTLHSLLAHARGSTRDTLEEKQTNSKRAYCIAIKHASKIIIKQTNIEICKGQNQVQKYMAAMYFLLCTV